MAKQKSTARDPRISEIFYYFEKYTTLASGRTVGRKIGVVQEILCKKLLLESPMIRDSIVYESRIAGHSGATHRIEFILFQPTSAVDLSVGQTLSIASNVALSVQQTDPAQQTAKVVLTTSKENRLTIRLGVLRNITKHIPNSNVLVKAVTIDADKVRFSVIDPAKPVASIESKRVGAQRFSASTKLGSGIQTIEKAKQASLVAVDFDLRYNGTLLAMTKDNAKRPFKSFVLLGNGIHWTEHDLAILETYADYTYLVRDAAVIRYADFVRNLADEKKGDFFPFFMTYFKGMTKTPADAFPVSEDDFIALRPRDAGSLLQAVEGQIQAYQSTVI